MTITISPKLKQALLSLHEIETPFYERDGKVFMRFDSITITQWANYYEATYSWKGHTLCSQRIHGADERHMSPRLTLGGFTGEMQVTIA